MKGTRITILILPLLLAACSTVEQRGTIAELRDRRIDIREERIEGGLEKAMAGYRQFLAETPDSPLAPEAIRRLADLKVEKEYGLIGGETPDERRKGDLPAPERAMIAVDAMTAQSAPEPAAPGESQAAFEDRATMTTEEGTTAAADPVGDDLERAGALEAIGLYEKLLAKYPGYERNDQVLYQMSRAYEELGRVDEAMDVMNRLVGKFPASRYLDEVQFRRAEYFFTRRKYLDAEEAYQSIIELGVGSSFYELAIYKLGWTFYKQELYEEAQHRFVAVLDHKVATGYDFAQTEDEPERKRIEDTFRVISLGFSYLGGADAVVDYFENQGRRGYEDRIYRHLAEYFFGKRRYADATAAYTAFMERNPFHEQAPHFHMRVIEINKAGGFPTLVIDAKKAFANTYGLQAEYWRHFEPQERPEVLDYLKRNLTDLAGHYHALYQEETKKKEKKAEYFDEALTWYRAFLASFPAEQESPAVNYQLADLLLEHGSLAEAAAEYEKTAYHYPTHEKSATAGYAAVYAWRQHLDGAPDTEKDPIRPEVVRSSLLFAGTFPEHDKAAIVLGAAADDLYAMGEHEPALAAATDLVENFPAADGEVQRSAWLVIAHSSYELERYPEAEAGYLQVLDLLPAEHPERAGLTDNLAAAIYKQGEQASSAEDFRAAADHFLRVGRLAPTSAIRAAAEYDAAAALIALADWPAAAGVLTGFRELFPGHQLQPEVTKKIAYVYREDGRLSEAAGEYERIEREADDDAVRREALLTAAELHEEAKSPLRALAVYRRYVEQFPQPMELNIETRDKIASMLKEDGDLPAYHEELERIVAVEAAAGEERTVRTRSIAARAGLVLAEIEYGRFVEVELVQPFEISLAEKQKRMKTATRTFGALLDYEVGEVTAAATYYLGEIYAHFSKALMTSERPGGLDPLAAEQYELAIEEQAYPFEEKAITVHESNLELIRLGIYNEWIEKSLEKLAGFVPAQYARPEEPSTVVASLESYTFAYGEPHREEPQVQALAATAPGQKAAPEGDRTGEEDPQPADSAAGGDDADTSLPATSAAAEDLPAKAGEIPEDAPAEAVSSGEEISASPQAETDDMEQTAPAEQQAVESSFASEAAPGEEAIVHPAEEPATPSVEVAGMREDGAENAVPSPGKNETVTEAPPTGGESPAEDGKAADGTATVEPASAAGPDEGTGDPETGSGDERLEELFTTGTGMAPDQARPVAAEENETEEPLIEDGEAEKGEGE